MHKGPPRLVYPCYDRWALVNGYRRIYSQQEGQPVAVLEGQDLGAEEVAEGAWFVLCMEHSFDYADIDEACP